MWTVITWLLWCIDVWPLHLQDLEQIQVIWELTKDWEEHWAQWKAGQFSALDTKPMEELANSTYKKLLKMSKELKVSA